MYPDNNREPMENLILIADPKVLAMPILENGDPLIEVRQIAKINVSSELQCPYPKSPSYSYVRKAVAQLLSEATKYLPSGINFYLEEGHRTLAVQKIVFDDYYTTLRKSHPEWDQSRFFIETIKYIAPPHNTPPHSTGGAIDITLINQKGQLLDMGSTMNETPLQNENKNFTYSPDISQQARANREILINALNQVGFVNYPTEWWHWSYGDRYWAYKKNQSFALYDSIEENIFSERNKNSKLVK